MSNEEKNRIYLEARQTLLELSKDEVVKIQGSINVSNGLVIGSAVSMLVLGFLDPNFAWQIPTLTGIIGLLANLISRYKKKDLMTKIDEDANKIANEMTDLSDMMNQILPNLFGGAADFIVGSPEQGPMLSVGIMPIGIGIHIGAMPDDFKEAQEDNVVEVDYELLDENGLSLADKCRLLIEYGNDVAYPGYEEDVESLTNILTVLTSGYPTANTNEYSFMIGQFEKMMFDKAYKFYTGDFSR